MKRTYLNPECCLIKIGSLDIITISDVLFGEILRFGRLGDSEDTIVNE